MRNLVYQHLQTAKGMERDSNGRTVSRSAQWRAITKADETN